MLLLVVVSAFVCVQTIVFDFVSVLAIVVFVVAVAHLSRVVFGGLVLVLVFACFCFCFASDTPKLFP